VLSSLIILSLILLFVADDGRLTLIDLDYLSESNSCLFLACISSESNAVCGLGGLELFINLSLLSLIKFF